MGTPEVAISYQLAPVASVSPSSLSFGGQPLGSSSAAKTVTLSNTGNAPLSVTSASVGGTNAGDFALSSDNCSGQSVAAGSSCTVQVAFAPTATGSRSGTLSFADNASGSPQTVALSGTGTTLADVSVGISGPSSAKTGSTDTYVINTANAGPSTATNVVMKAQVPYGTKFQNVSTTRGTCTHPASGATSGTISCPLGDLAKTGSALNAVSIKITLRNGGNVTLVASSYSTATNSTPATPDPNLSNNVASFSTSVS